jgi:hypothetical protein
MLIGSAGFGAIALQGISSADLKMGKRTDRFI